MWDGALRDVGGDGEDGDGVSVEWRELLDSRPADDEVSMDEAVCRFLRLDDGITSGRMPPLENPSNTLMFASTRNGPLIVATRMAILRSDLSGTSDGRKLSRASKGRRVRSRAGAADERRRALGRRKRGNRGVDEARRPAQDLDVAKVLLVAVDLMEYENETRDGFRGEEEEEEGVGIGTGALFERLNDADGRRLAAPTGSVDDLEIGDSTSSSS
jgi:hypothetical protein